MKPNCIPEKLYEMQKDVFDAVIAETLEKAAKVCDDLYKHDRRASGYFEGWNDALDIAGQEIRSIK